MNDSIERDRTNDTSYEFEQKKIIFNNLIEQQDNLKPQITPNNNENIYYVSKFDENSEEYTHIQKIIPLKITPIKRIIYIILNVLSFGIINLFMKWFPSLKTYFRYNITNLLNASYLGIYGMDGEMTIKNIKKIDFPVIDL